MSELRMNYAFQQPASLQVTGEATKFLKEFAGFNDPVWEWGHSGYTRLLCKKTTSDPRADCSIAFGNTPPGMRIENVTVQLTETIVPLNKNSMWDKFVWPIKGGHNTVVRWEPDQESAVVTMSVSEESSAEDQGQQFAENLNFMISVSKIAKPLLRLMHANEDLNQGRVRRFVGQALEQLGDLLIQEDQRRAS